MENNMAKNNFYGVRVGRKTGVFKTWDECKAQVEGYPGAVYKGFIAEFAAIEYVNGVQDKAATNEVKENKPIAYVDGSFDETTGRYAYGVAILYGNTEVHLSGTGDNPGMAQMRNVAGEIMGAMEAMRYAKNNGIDELVIYHDYQGISSWATREWKANKPETQAYQRFCDKAFDIINVSFKKVKGHSNDFYNDVVDALAKNALGITSGIKKATQEHIENVAATQI